jgi:hypothetical protein
MSLIFRAFCPVQDIYVIDEVLVRTFSGFFRTAASVFSVLFVIGMGAPVVLLGVIPLADPPLYAFLPNLPD